MHPIASRSLSIHDLTRRSTCRRNSSSAYSKPFNSRPHKEVDCICPLFFQSISTFNSRPHKEVDMDHARRCDRRDAFNSRPHKEVDLVARVLNGTQKPFNSRPHKEVDERLNTYKEAAKLSIHDLTRRSTYCRRTGRMAVFSFNSRPHKEVDTARSSTTSV